jgi:ParB/RepB/Spo0J family partition protein
VKRPVHDFLRGEDPDDYVGQVIRIPTRLVKQLPGQPRTFFDAKQMKRLRDSISEIGQQSPATVIPWDDGTFRLRDGERRWRSCTELKLPLLALVVEAKELEEEFELSTAANMNRESHSPLEKALSMKRLRDGPLKRSVAEIARTFGVSDQTVYNHMLVVDQLPQDVVDLLDPNKMGDRRRTLQVSVAVQLTALKDYPRDQVRLARKFVKEGTPMSAALRMIDHFADSKKIAEGRGRERKPSDQLKTLSSAIRRIEPQLKHFCRQTQREIDELFEFTPPHRHEELASMLEQSIEMLQQLRDRVVAVENVGIKRGGAAA